MRKLVIATCVLASVRIAASQPADPAAPPETEAQPAEEAAPPPAEPTVPVVVAEPKKEKPAVKATYDNGLRLESSDKQYELKIQFRNQVRFESLRPTENNSQFLNTFYIPRSRLQAEGYVFGDVNRYKLELGLGDQGSFSFVRDMFIERRLSDAPVYLRFGQWKRPFSRSEMVSDFAAEFNERSIANELAGGGRSQGIALHNDYEKSPAGIEWAIGMFNTFNGGSDRPVIPVSCTTAGSGAVNCVDGRPTDFPLDFAPALVARAGWNSPNAKGYSEVDLEGGPLRYSIGASYKVDLGNFAKHGKPSVADNMSHGLELDWNLKVNGISFTGLLVMMKIKDAETQLGFNLQPGIMLVPKKIEVAARFALTTEEGDRNNIEALGALNFFANGHRLKLATDFGILKTTGEDPVTMTTDDPDVRVRIMAQLEI